MSVFPPKQTKLEMMAHFSKIFRFFFEKLKLFKSLGPLDQIFASATVKYQSLFSILAKLFYESFSNVSVIKMKHLYYFRLSSCNVRLNCDEKSWNIASQLLLENQDDLDPSCDLWLTYFITHYITYYRDVKGNTLCKNSMSIVQS